MYLPQFNSSLYPLILLIVSMMLVVSCSKQDPAARIADLEGKLKSATSVDGSKIRTEEVEKIMSDLVGSYEAYAKASPTAEDSPEYLYKAAEMYENNLRDPNKALALFQKIRDDFPDNPRAADALFKMGFIHHNILNDLPNAERIYKEFIAKYPTHELVSSAKFEITNLGVSPEEILKRIQQQDSVKATATK